MDGCSSTGNMMVKKAHNRLAKVSALGASFFMSGETVFETGTLIL